MADTRTKALSYLRGGQVRAHTVATPPDALRPSLVLATVHGHNGRYQIVYDATRSPADRWSCACWRSELCPHISAVGLVTGFQHLAARPEPTARRTS